MWVEAGCPSEHNPQEHPVITQKLVPFREEIVAATPKHRAEFLELARAYEGENQYS
jgi:hypothetical protein